TTATGRHPHADARKVSLYVDNRPPGGASPGAPTPAGSTLATSPARSPLRLPPVLGTSAMSPTSVTSQQPASSPGGMTPMPGKGYRGSMASRGSLGTPGGPFLDPVRRKYAGFLVEYVQDARDGGGGGHGSYGGLTVGGAGKVEVGGKRASVEGHAQVHGHGHGKVGVWDSEGARVRTAEERKEESMGIVVQAQPPARLSHQSSRRSDIMSRMTKEPER
ncbi:hypothetical protein HK101_006165, partial [Irineochytrium annulatum]